MSFYFLRERSTRILGKVKSPPFVNSHEGWGLCTVHQIQSGEDDLMIVTTLTVIMPVDGTVAEAEARVAEISR